MNTEPGRSRKKSEPLHFIEFMEICADSGIIGEETARRICLFAKYQGGVGALPAVPDASEDNYAERFEYLLGFSDDDTKSFDNYVVSEENFHAVELARTVALIPKIWRNLSPVLFYGHTGQGKTHLLSAMARASGARSLLLNTNDLMMEYRYCMEAGKDLELLNWITRHNFLLLDDIQFAQGNFAFQNFLCSVFNRLSSERNAVVLCSNIEPEDNRDYHITFYSRITAGITIELKMLDYDARIELLKRKFSSTGFGPDDNIITYIASEIKANVRTLKAAARAVIACMLSTPGRSEIDLPTVKKLLKSMHFYDVPGIAASRKDQKAPAPPPKPMKPEQPDPEDTEEEAPAIEPSPFIVIDVDEEKPEGDTEKGQLKNVVASASTVDKQIEALLEAAEKRVGQLRQRNARPEEIAKLEKAIDYLREKNLEEAMLSLK